MFRPITAALLATLATVALGSLAEAAPPTTPAPGEILGSIPSAGVALIVFGGGDNARLTAQATAAGCAVDQMAFFTITGGDYIAFVPTAPQFVNDEWGNRFGGNIPAGTPLLMTCMELWRLQVPY